MASNWHRRRTTRWDADTGAALQTLEGHSAATYIVAFSPDGKQLASASFDNTVKLWDAGVEAALQTLDLNSIRETLQFFNDGTPRGGR